MEAKKETTTKAPEKTLGEKVIENISSEKETLTGIIKAAASWIGLAVGIAVGYFLFARGKEKEIEKLKKEVEELKEQIGFYKDKIRELKEPQEEKKTLAGTVRNILTKEREYNQIYLD